MISLRKTLRMCKGFGWKDSVQLLDNDEFQPLLETFIPQEKAFDRFKTKTVKGHPWKKLFCSNVLGKHQS
jgi:hypothetical protein